MATFTYGVIHQSVCSQQRLRRSGTKPGMIVSCLSEYCRITAAPCKETQMRRRWRQEGESTVTAIECCRHYQEGVEVECRIDYYVDRVGYTEYIFVPVTLLRYSHHSDHSDIALTFPTFEEDEDVYERRRKIPNRGLHTPSLRDFTRSKPSLEPLILTERSSIPLKLYGRLCIFFVLIFSNFLLHKILKHSMPSILEAVPCRSPLPSLCPFRFSILPHGPLFATFSPICSLIAFSANLALFLCALNARTSA